MKRSLPLLVLLLATTLASLTPDDWRFCLDHELWSIVGANRAELMDRLGRATAAGDTLVADECLHLLDRYAAARQDTLAQLRILARRAIDRHDFTAAFALHGSLASFPAWADSLPVARVDSLFRDNPVDTATLRLAAESLPDSVRTRRQRELLLRVGETNPVLAGWAREWVDEMAVERNDSLRLAAVDRFLKIPRSVWKESLQAWRWSALIAQQRQNQAAVEIYRASISPGASPALLYIAARQVLDPAFLKHAGFPLPDTGKPDSVAWRDYAGTLLDRLDKTLAKDRPGTFRVFYDEWNQAYLRSKVAVLRARLALAALKPSNRKLRDLRKLATAYSQLQKARYDNNDAGELAELWYWRGMVVKEFSADYREAALDFVKCLAAGSPRKRYDVEAMRELSVLHDRLGIGDDVMTWARQLMDYTGPVFDDATEAAGLADRHESRVAWGDYDGDGRFDLLLNGNRLFHNEGNGAFTDLSDSLQVSGYPSCGGLWTDFDRDGRLDYMSISHDRNGNGDKLMRQLISGEFSMVNDRAGEIDDRFSTEGAAWFDIGRDGWPDLYCASYENPGFFSGYPDFVWRNHLGHFTDVSDSLGFRGRYNNDRDSQCGRGVAPADYDNDGDQELLVTNYRLDRNFLFDRRDSVYADIAGLEFLQGFETDGWFGHSIGADWGDFDNDGDLDLLIANLAHPRYIAFSDITALYRNDGPADRYIGQYRIHYTRFTEVAAQSGIQYDELHSDPTWFDADNDGDLDLFITSIYENERSYLYLNDGNGHFDDVTFLAGCRVYNGWGNAVADYDGDGNADLCVGSGSGVKLLHNAGNNGGRSVAFRLFLDNTGAHALPVGQWKPGTPNTPPWSARIELVTRSKAGRTVTRIRELCSAKGTTSQNAQDLSFGIGDETPLRANLIYNGIRSDIPLSSR